EVDRLAGLVDDLLALSRLQSGELGLAVERIDARDVVSDTLAAADPLAAARGVRLRGESLPPLPVLADERELSRALSNLVVNAVRHTPAGGEVVLDARRRDQSVILSVQDGCGGIPEADLARMFEPGWRGEAARTPGDGAGLGLAVVHEVMAAHGGRVMVSNSGRGCRFDLVLVDPGTADAP
ncbi:MAG: sensor histidine kinase, partial [Candidatus Nanopelagicales bacterium]